MANGTEDINFSVKILSKTKFKFLRQPFFRNHV